MADNSELKPELNVDLDRLVHEPVRLKILAILTQLESADFVYLVSRLKLTMGNLSAHVSKLEKAGYIEVMKDFKDNRPHTMLSLTKRGKKAFNSYREDMLELLQ
jgi:DNA-binding MarR family transcriptional regulator